MEISEEFAKLFPKSTWSDEEIAEAMFTPDGVCQNSDDFTEFDNEEDIQLDIIFDEYVKQNKMVDLEDFLNNAKKYWL